MSKQKKNKNRIVIVTPADVTAEQAAEALAAVRQAAINRTVVDGTRAQKIKLIDDEYAPRFQEIDALIAQQTEIVRVYATKHPELFGPKNKSVAWLHGRFGFRTGMPECVKKVKAGWDKIVDLVRETLGAEYIRTRTVEEVNKEQIIANRDKLDAKVLRSAGLAIEQDESFFIEPNIPAAPETATTTAKAA